MNKPRFLCTISLIALMAFPLAHAQQNATSSVGLTNYMDQASLELRHLRNMIDATMQETPLAGRPQLAPYVNALSAAEQSLADLKTASTFERTRRQSDFESAKDNAIRLWEGYRASHAGPASDPTPLASRAAESLE